MEITRDMGIVTKLVKGNDLSRSTRFHDEKKPNLLDGSSYVIRLMQLRHLSGIK